MTHIKNLHFSFSAILLGLGSIFWLSSPPPTRADVFSDGPYVLYTDTGMVATWMDQNTQQTIAWPPPADWHIDPSVSPTFDPQYVQSDYAPEVDSQVQFSDVERIAAISDIHGQYHVARKLLEENGIIDEAQNWAFGEGHLVITGDVFDRGDQVTETLWLIHKLEQQALKAGGRVHFLLGNHELLVLHGDFRYLHKKYRYTTAALQMPFDALFNQKSYLGRWLRSLPVSIKINDIAFVHGGFSPEVIKETPSLEEINTIFHTKIINSNAKEIIEDELLQLLYFEQGPLWYRDYFAADKLEKAALKKILKKLDVQRIVVGHTSFVAITTMFDNRIIGIDSSIKLGKTGEMLLYESGDLYRASIFGERTKIE